ncbi:pentapeptide repeat-containing protein [Pseudanabaena sp. UWO310]|uniref:pentapeptide repeat-containing protein n=1 Tax=Pseudanabaena sp. UWO310 TaxID=2480795 RepID=UPI001157F2C3|nr:pentapeptide repeat-containing protein [Pseudanabaena sp. UWO310]TYQ29846.1 hypothetical protein PseudUWO310_11630 [Pseudanabaena sp. UWO310]
MVSTGNTTQNLFIKPNVDLTDDPQYKIDLLTMVNLSKTQLKERWDTAEGKQILNTWKGNKFDRSVLDGLVGKYYGQTDLRGIRLSNESLTKLDLNNIDFYGANLENTDFTDSRLIGSWLSESNIKGTRFDRCLMEKVLIDSVEYNSKTRFLGVDLNSINFNLAVLLQDLALGQQRIINLEKTRPNLAFLLRISCDYGRSLNLFLFWCLTIVFVFAIGYWITPKSLTTESFWESLYFSALTFVTVTFSIQPVSVLGKLLSLIEAFIGYLMTGLLVAILVKKTVGN